MYLRFVISIIAGLLCFSCARRIAVAPVASGRAVDHSFLDLKAGDRIRIVLPLTKSGNPLPRYNSEEHHEGATITLSASDLVGFKTAHYRAVASHGGKVELRFVAAEESREGKATPQNTPPRLPFDLPEKPLHLRLVYLIRASTADHNMAIVGARNIKALDSFTERVKQNGAVCEQTKDIFCEWVPAGVAVRPES